MVRLFPEDFEPYQTLAALQPEVFDAAAEVGAQGVFIGTMRAHNAGDRVRQMFLEHYPEMTAKELSRILAEADARWSLQASLVAHRVGMIRPGQTIVLVATWSTHRAAAFEACRFITEGLKHRAPFWKQEQLQDGTWRWVSMNTPATAT